MIVELSFTPDGKQVIAGNGHTPLGVFDAVTGKKLRELGKTSINNHHGFALSPDGRTVACCGFDLGLWDFATGKLVRELGCGRCQAVAISPDSARVAVVKEFRPEILLFDIATGKQLDTTTVAGKGGKAHEIHSLTFSPDGRHLAGMVSELRRDTPQSRTLVVTRTMLWDAGAAADAPTLAPADELGSAGDPAFTPAFQPGTGRLVTTDKDGGIRFREVPGGKEVQTISRPKEGGWSALRFTADGKQLAAYSREGFLSVLDAATFREREEAGRQLLAVGEGAVPELRKALAKGLSPEATARAEKVVEALNRGVSSEQRRLLRALAVLDWSGRADTDEHIKKLAGGDPAVRLTRAAKAAVERRGLKSSR